MTVTQEAEIISLYCCGATYALIARRLGVSVYAVSRVLQRNGIRLGKQQ